MQKIIASALALLLAFSLSSNAVAGFDWAGWQPSDQLQQKINKVIERINNNPNMSQAQKDRLTSILSGTLYSQAQVTAHWENRNQRISVWISNQAEDKQDKLNAWLARRVAHGAPDADIINKKKQRALIKRIAKRIKKKRNPPPDTPPGDG